MSKNTDSIDGVAFLGIGFCVSHMEERDADFIANMASAMIGELGLPKTDDIIDVVGATLTQVYIGAWLRGYGQHIRDMEESD